MFGFFRRQRRLDDGELLLLILERQNAMALDFTALNAGIAKLSADVDTLISEAGSTPQSTVDAVTASVKAVSDKAEAAIAALTPPAPVAQ
jgi:hypothetical protein